MAEPAEDQVPVELTVAQYNTVHRALGNDATKAEIIAARVALADAHQEAVDNAQYPGSR